MSILRTNILNFLTGEIVPSAIVNGPKTYITQKSNNTLLVEAATPTAPLIVPLMSITLPAGTYSIVYNSEFRVTDTSSVTTIAKSDLVTLYNELNAMNATVVDHGVTYGSETLSPGVYTNAAATNVTGTLTLDGGDDTNALFVFRTGGAFSTAASAEVLLTNGARSANVWFVSEGASSTGANSIMKGNILANQAAASVGNNTHIEGRMFAINGAAGIDASAFTIAAPVGPSIATLGATLGDFSIFCGVGNVSNTGTSSVALNIGTDAGTITGFESSTIEGNLFPSGSDTLGKIFAGIYIDGVLFESSQRSQTRTFREVGSEFPLLLQSVISTTADQVVDIRVYTSIGKVRIGPNMLLIAEPLHSAVLT